MSRFEPIPLILRYIAPESVDFLPAVTAKFRTRKTPKFHFAIETSFIVVLAPRAGKINEIARCDWLLERARWSLPAVSRKKNFPESHIINPLLTKFVRSRWLDIWPRSFFASLLTSTSSRSIETLKENLGQ